MTIPTIEGVAARLDGLERENRRLRWIAAGLLVAAVLVATRASVAGRPDRGVVVAEKVVIKDKAGQVRASLGLDASDMPGLEMFDTRGNTQVALVVQSDSTSMLTLSDRGNTRVTLDASVGGASALRMYDIEQRSTSTLFMSPDSRSGLAFNIGKQGLIMGVQPSGESAVFSLDPSGEEQARLGDESVDLYSLGLMGTPIGAGDDAGPRTAAPWPVRPRSPIIKPERPLDRISEARDTPAGRGVQARFRGASS